MWKVDYGRAREKAEGTFRWLVQWSKPEKATHTYDTYMWSLEFLFTPWPHFARASPSTQPRWHIGSLIGQFQSVDSCLPQAIPISFPPLPLFLFLPVSQIPICPSPDSAFMRSYCSHSIPFPLLIPPLMKVTWIRGKEVIFFPTQKHSGILNLIEH